MINFVIIGNPKSGSSSLHEILNQQEKIEMSLNKEPGFFYHSDFKIFNRLYKLNYSTKPFEIIRGESSVGYSIRKEALINIKKYNPRIKIVLLIREPISRTYSHFWHRVKMGEIKKTLCELIENNPSHDIFEYSRYTEQLELIDKIFEMENVFIMNFRDISNKNKITELIKFLGASTPNEINLVFSNKAKIFKSKIINNFINYIRINFDFTFMPKIVYFPLKFFWHKLKSINMKDFNYPIISEKEKKLLSILFKKEISYYNNLNND